MPGKNIASVGMLTIRKGSFLCLLLLAILLLSIPSALLAQESSRSLSFDLQCPPQPERDDAGDTLGADDEPVGGGETDGSPGGKRLPKLTVTALGIEIGIHDANPLFFPSPSDRGAEGDERAVVSLDNSFPQDEGGEGVSTGVDVYPSPPGAATLEELTFEEILKIDAVREGFAADGVTRLLVLMKTGVEGTFEIETEPAGEAAGELVILRDGKTCDTEKGHVAVALLRAPETFGRGSGMRPPADEDRVGRAEAREMDLHVRFTPAQGEGSMEQTETLKVVRPPVVLVHGLFDDPVNAWLTPDALNSTTLPARLDQAGFVPFLVDYYASSGRSRGVTADRSSFEDNRFVVWTGGRGSGEYVEANAGWLAGATEKARRGGIGTALSYYRDELKIAATQADLIGHSMGGILSRVNASDELPPNYQGQASTPYNENYKRPANFRAGDINRLITIDSPHHGSGQTELFELLTQKNIEGESWSSWFARTGAKWYPLLAEAVRVDTKAVQDLRLQSDALKRIGETHVPSHVVVAVTRPGGLHDTTYDADGRYMKEVGLIGALFFYFPELLDEYVAMVGKDYADEHPNKEEREEFVEDLRNKFLDLIASEAEYWRRLRDDAGFMQRYFDPTQQTSETVPYMVVEALRGLMFRFDNNDVTVRVDSQLGGLEIESGFVTYASSEKSRDLPRRAHIQDSVFHSIAQRHGQIQIRIVDVLKSGFTRFAESLPPAGARMKPKEVPKNLGATWYITGEFAKAWSGMVPAHADAFLDVATDENAIIMVRPVNPDSTALILLGSGTKGMNVKGKSSNWGPQKGFIARDQHYSKLWRIYSDPKRKEEIDKYSALTEEVLAAQKDEYKHPETGKPIVTTRQLEHRWPFCSPTDDCSSPARKYTVWIDPDMSASNPETSIYLCRGEPPIDDPCACGENWFDWRTHGDGSFDIHDEPTVKVSPPFCSKLRAMQVLADNTYEGEPKPYLTADYDLLTTGFFCPEKKQSQSEACQAEVGKQSGTGDNPAACTEPDETIFAQYDQLWHPPEPAPCFDPHLGLITEAQKKLIKEINRQVEEEKNYTGGNVTHHGPETQFFKSPYVDYPITIFDPGGSGEEQPAIIAIPRGPKGFRDVHLKRYYERKIHQGYWLYPNTGEKAGWQWEERLNGGTWQGWQYYDAQRLTEMDDVEELPRPRCVQEEIERLMEIRRNPDDADPPQPRPESCGLSGGGEQ